MGLRYQRRKSLGGGARLNASKTGLSVSQRVGPLTLNSRGRGSLRLAPGLSYRFGSRKKNDATGAIIMLLVFGAILAIEVALVALRVVLVLAVWLIRWAYFSGQAFLERRRLRELPSSAE
jgi:hypothetical protein